MTKIKINGVPYDVSEGATILDTINQNEIAHPQICHLPEVDPIETCDTCIVEVDGTISALMFNRRSRRNERPT